MVPHGGHRPLIDALVHRLLGQFCHRGTASSPGLPRPSPRPRHSRSQRRHAPWFNDP